MVLFKVPAGTFVPVNASVGYQFDRNTVQYDNSWRRACGAYLCGSVQRDWRENPCP